MKLLIKYLQNLKYSVSISRTNYIFQKKFYDIYFPGNIMLINWKTISSIKLILFKLEEVLKNFEFIAENFDRTDIITPMDQTLRFLFNIFLYTIFI